MKHVRALNKSLVKLITQDALRRDGDHDKDKLRFYLKYLIVLIDDNNGIVTGTVQFLRNLPQ